MTRVGRIVAVTLGLSVAGAVLGAVASVVAILLVTAFTDQPPIPLHHDVLGFAAAFGAGVGIIAAPAGAWLLLRSVPLGRAMLWSVLGTIFGGVALWTAPIGHDQIGRAVVGAVLGFLGAALVLRRTAARARPTRTPATAPLD